MTFFSRATFWLSREAGFCLCNHDGVTLETDALTAETYAEECPRHGDPSLLVEAARLIAEILLSRKPKTTESPHIVLNVRGERVRKVGKPKAICSCDNGWTKDGEICECVDFFS